MRQAINMCPSHAFCHEIQMLSNSAVLIVLLEAQESCAPKRHPAFVGLHSSKCLRGSFFFATKMRLRKESRRFFEAEPIHRLIIPEKVNSEIYNTSNIANPLVLNVHG